MKNKKQKYYVVWQGKQTGVFTDWKDCEAQIKGFAEAKFKSFDTLEEAEKALLYLETSNHFRSAHVEAIEHWHCMSKISVLDTMIRSCLLELIMIRCSMKNYKKFKGWPKRIKRD